MATEYKGYAIKPVNGDPRSLEIKNTKQGGSLPLRFVGKFTDYRTAKETIDAYLSAGKVKE